MGFSDGWGSVMGGVSLFLCYCVFDAMFLFLTLLFLRWGGPGAVVWQWPHPPGPNSTLPVLALPDLDGDGAGEVALVCPGATQVNPPGGGGGSNSLLSPPSFGPGATREAPGGGGGGYRSISISLLDLFT